MIDYKSFPGLTGVFLEDSYVLGISESSGQVVFHLNAVLTPEHSAYHSPRLGEQHCYATGSLILADVTRVQWLKRNSSHYTALPAKRISGTSTFAQWTVTDSSQRVIGGQFGSPEHNRASNSKGDSR